MSTTHRHGGPECRAIFERLSEYIDGELPSDLCDTIEGHLGDCPPCEAFLESLRRTVRWVEAAGESPSLPDEVREAIRTAWKRHVAGSGPR